MEMRMAFIGTVRSVTDPIMDRISEIEEELTANGLQEKFGTQLSFVKAHLTPNLARITPQQLDSTYQNISKALAYITELQTLLVQKKSEQLFSEYLPKKNHV